MGFYSVCPGAGQYAIGSPLFNKITLHLENGNNFRINAKNNSKENIYIENAKLNGSGYTKNYITHADLMNGGLLDFEMGNVPDYNKGINSEDFPYSFSKEQKK
jgi:putative alpha-1,2-mannosidase